MVGNMGDDPDHLTPIESRDWKESGFCIRQAVVEAWNPEARGPVKIRWGRNLVVTGDFLEVPSQGTVQLEFLTSRPGLKQGADLQVNGAILLPDGSSVTLLRTWFEPGLPSLLEYPYAAEDGRLFTCNVYEVPDSRATNDWRWGDYAGMWVETLSTRERVYHCSHRDSADPDFEDLVYRVAVT